MVPATIRVALERMGEGFILQLLSGFLLRWIRWSCNHYRVATLMMRCYFMHAEKKWIEAMKGSMHHGETLSNLCIIAGPSHWIFNKRHLKFDHCREISPIPTMVHVNCHGSSLTNTISPFISENKLPFTLRAKALLRSQTFPPTYLWTHHVIPMQQDQ